MLFQCFFNAFQCLVNAFQCISIILQCFLQCFCNTFACILKASCMATLTDPCILRCFCIFLLLTSPGCLRLEDLVIRILDNWCLCLRQETSKWCPTITNHSHTLQCKTICKLKHARSGTAMQSPWAFKHKLLCGWLQLILVGAHMGRLPCLLFVEPIGRFAAFCVPNGALLPRGSCS